MKQALMDALINDRTKHPERLHATGERLFEVLENVLKEDAAPHVKEISAILGSFPIREGLTPELGKRIVTYIFSLALDKNPLQAIIDQLMAAEISTEEAIALHETHKIPVSTLEKDLIPVSGKGCWLMDTKGKTYLDMDSNYSATNLGMANEEIAKGLFNQASQLISMKEDRVQIARSRLFKTLLPMMPQGLHYFYFQNSGGEAVDKALKIAKAYTGNRHVIAFKNGFHGRTHGAVAVTWNEAYRKPFGLDHEDWVHFADFNNVESVQALMEKTQAKIIILEMIQGEEAGNLAATQAFIDDLFALAKERGALIIADEVQTGFGRTAVKKNDWFACMGFRVIPDIMTIGKSFGGGYPVTAVVTRKEISQAMKGGYDGSTFGGNPMAMTAALIATRQMQELDITGNVIARSKQFEEGLQKLSQKYNYPGEIRVRGLMIAFSMGSPERVHAVQDALKDHGVMSSLSTGGFLRILPPTIISEEEVDFFLKALEKSIKQTE
ncbi:MAG: aspartate aminotransferase family protein [Candidatus Marinimicrobia bacterium]|nr:aspartate aminotransferase family protein [Candidatus Neomarinimicrobiota bacterium]